MAYQVQLRRLGRRLEAKMAGMRLYAEALRAQTHEFMNGLHVILGLVRLEEYDRLSGYIAGLLGDLRAELGQLAQRIKDPLLAGFLMARCSAARTRTSPVVLTEASQVPVCADEAVARDLVTILGNLLENAVEAMGASATRQIRVDLQHDADRLDLEVADTGPGVPAGYPGPAVRKGVHHQAGGPGGRPVSHRPKVAALGGRLTVGDRPGGGAVFRASVRYPAGA